jgi:hypothetical protein
MLSPNTGGAALVEAAGPQANVPSAYNMLGSPVPEGNHQFGESSTGTRGLIEHRQGIVAQMLLQHIFVQFTNIYDQEPTVAELEDLFAGAARDVVTLQGLRSSLSLM